MRCAAGTRRAAGLAAIACANLLAGGCGEPAPRGPAPTLPRAALVLEPTRIGVGEVATLELAVATPPRHVPRPWIPPETQPGFWILGVETLPVEQEGARWIHRTRVRVRARELGTFTWPGGTLEIETPEGGRLQVGFEPLAIEVASLAAELPERRMPFGLRGPRTRPEGAAGWPLAAAGGAALTLAAGAALRAGRRRRTRVAAIAPATGGGAAARPAWVEARAGLARARELAGGDPFAAADCAARTLRRYAGERFASRAPVQTSEELARAPAPLAAATRWPALVAALASLDAQRFRPRGDPETRAALARGLPDALAQAERFVAETIPPGAPP